MSSTSTSPGAVLTISQNPGIVTVIERFDVPKDRQAEAVDTAHGHIKRIFALDPDSMGAVLLRSRISGGVSIYMQWKRPAAGAAPLAPPEDQSLSPAMAAFPTLMSKTFSVKFSDFAPSVAPPTRVSVEQTPAGHFGMFTLRPENQNRMVDLARAFGPKSLNTPGLLAINFHRSLDGERVINFGQWTYVETDFNKLTPQPGFRRDDLYWDAVAKAEPDFFDIVAVEAKA